MGGADACALPDVIVGTGPFAFDDTTATTGTEGQGEAACTLFGNTAIKSDVWFVWTAPASGIAVVTTVNHTIADTKIAAYPAPFPGGGCPVPGSALACNDESCASIGPPSVSFPVTAGQAHVLQLGAWPGALASSGTFTISLGSQAGVPYCFGDGTGASCPCSPALVAPGVAPSGCPNSFYAGGANLRADGVASVAADALSLEASGMPNGACLYFQGTAAVAGGSVFGDGLMCVGGAIARLGIKPNFSGWSMIPGAGELGIASAGSVPAVGGVRVYQVWYRNSDLFCTNAGHNLTNGVSVNWVPWSRRSRRLQPSRRICRIQQ